jgi:hypothetical protein
VGAGVGEEGRIESIVIARGGVIGPAPHVVEVMGCPQCTAITTATAALARGDSGARPRPEPGAVMSAIRCLPTM